MGRFLAAAHVDAPPEVAFDGFADLQRLPRWFPLARKVTAASGPLSEAGTTYTLHFVGGFRARCKVVSVERPVVHERTFVLRPFGGHGRARMRFSPEGTGSRVQLDGHWTLPLGPLGRALDRAFDLGGHQAGAEVKRFKPFVERSERIASKS